MARLQQFSLLYVYTFIRQATMTAKRKREVEEAERAAEIAAQASLSSPTSTRDTRFAKSYVMGAWGQGQRIGNLGSGDSRDGDAPMPSRNVPTAKLGRRYGIGAWGQRPKMTSAAVDLPVKTVVERSAPKPVRFSRPVTP